MQRCGSSSGARSEEHTSELQSRRELVCRLLLEKKKYALALPATVPIAPRLAVAYAPQSPVPWLYIQNSLSLNFLPIYGSFFFNDPATTEIYTLSLHDALPIPKARTSLFRRRRSTSASWRRPSPCRRSEEHTSELQSRRDLVCRLLLEKKKKNKIITPYSQDKKKTNKK